MQQPSDQTVTDITSPRTLSREHGHALKNIFSIIIANAEMIGDAIDGSSPVNRRLERIIEACRRGEQLVDLIRTSGPGTAFDTPIRTDPPLSAAKLQGRVMVVDDEPDVVEIIGRYLSKEGLEIIGQTDSVGALNRLLSDPRPFDLVITDLDMPQCSGADLCKRLHATHPNMPVILITGYGRSVSQEEIAQAGIREMLSKPINRQLLLDSLRRLLSA
jgi:CheY-like chemotaxis protein